MQTMCLLPADTRIAARCLLSLPCSWSKLHGLGSVHLKQKWSDTKKQEQHQTFLGGGRGNKYYPKSRHRIGTSVFGGQLCKMVALELALGWLSTHPIMQTHHFWPNRPEITSVGCNQIPNNTNTPSVSLNFCTHAFSPISLLSPLTQWKPL